MNHGKLIRKNTSTSIMEEIDGKVFEALVDEEKLAEMQASFKVSNIVTTADGINVRFLNDSGKEIAVVDAKVATPNLEDVYLHFFET